MESRSWTDGSLDNSALAPLRGVDDDKLAEIWRILAVAVDPLTEYTSEEPRAAELLRELREQAYRAAIDNANRLAHDEEARNEYLARAESIWNDPGIVSLIDWLERADGGVESRTADLAEGPVAGIDAEDFEGQSQAEEV